MIRLIGKPLYQWDTGREVSVTSHDGVTIHEVHFANEGAAEALVVNVTTEDGVITAAIPNSLLKTGRSVIAYAVSLTDNGEETVESRTFPVRERQKPEDYIEAEDVSAIRKLLQDVTQATENANNVAQELLVAKENGEFTGEPGPAGPQGEKGDAGEQGPQGEKGDKGATGATGDDGYSVLTVAISPASPDSVTNVTYSKFSAMPKVGDLAISTNGYLYKVVSSTLETMSFGVEFVADLNGADGYTPVRGTDYWTEADKSEIKAYVDEAILGGAW